MSCMGSFLKTLFRGFAPFVLEGCSIFIDHFKLLAEKPRFRPAKNLDRVLFKWYTV